MRFIGRLGICLGVAFLAACGGGGGGSEATEDPPAPSAPAEGFWAAGPNAGSILLIGDQEYVYVRGVEVRGGAYVQYRGEMNWEGGELKPATLGALRDGVVEPLAVSGSLATDRTLILTTSPPGAPAAGITTELAYAGEFLAPAEPALLAGKWLLYDKPNAAAAGAVTFPSEEDPESPQNFKFTGTIGACEFIGYISARDFDFEPRNFFGITIYAADTPGCAERRTRSYSGEAARLGSQVTIFLRDLHDQPTEAFVMVKE